MSESQQPANLSDEKPQPEVTTAVAVVSREETPMPEKMRFKFGTEEELWERRRYIVEQRAQGLPYRKIALELDLAVSTICRDAKLWYQRAGQEFDPAEARQEIGTKFGQIYTWLVASFVTTKDLRERCMVVDRMIRCLEIQSKVLGIYQDATVNIGANAGAVYHADVHIPSDPAGREELARRLRAVREISDSSSA